MKLNYKPIKLKVWDSVENPIGDFIYDNTNYKPIKNKVMTNIENDLWHYVNHSAHNFVIDIIRNSVRSSIKYIVLEYVSDSIFFAY